MAGDQVGLAHEIVYPVGDSLYVTILESEVAVERMGEVLRLTETERWVERTDGTPVSCHFARTGSGEQTEISVAVRPGGVEVVKTVHGREERHVVPFEGQLLFPRGVAALAAAHPDSGAVFSYAVFDPDFEKPSFCEVAVQGRDTVHVAGAPKALTKLTVRSSMYEGIDIERWVDDSGDVWLERIPQLGMEMARAEEGSFGLPVSPPDIVMSTAIRTNAAIPDPPRVDEALYEIWLEGGDVRSLLSVDDRQFVERDTPRGVLVRVLRGDARATRWGAVSPDTGALAEYLAGNLLMQTWDTRLRETAEEIVAGTEDPVERADLISAAVSRLIRHRGFGTAFASALEVLESGAGDCSEHAVLAAALGRVVGLPSRVVVGVVHFDGCFAYHMWVEFWVGRAWYATDPTLGAGGVDATHIKLGESSLAGGAIGDLSLAILRSVNRLRVRVVEYTSAGATVRVGMP